MTEHYDFIIIGSGMGGGAAAYALSKTGKSVLLLERGGFLRRSKDNWDTTKVLGDGIYFTADRWYDRNNHAFRPRQAYCVGGLTKFYGAKLMRFRAEDFGELNHLEGKSPSWPLSYNDFEKYYGMVEELFVVHGIRGEDVNEPPASSPYPYPPVPHEPMVEEVVAGLRKNGLHPFHLPAGIMLNEKDVVNSPCIRCDTCAGYPCLLHAKADAETVCVRPALRHRNLTLLTDTRVIKLKTDPSGKSIAEVIAIRKGEELRYRGNIVILSAGAINSAALLIASHSDKHPNGLANRSGMVGRNLMVQVNSGMVAINPSRANPTIFQKTVGINDFYLGNPADRHFNFPLGHIHSMIKTSPESLKAIQPCVPMPLLSYIARHSFDWFFVTEDLPLPENRVGLTRDGSIKLHYRATNVNAHKRLVKIFGRMLRKIGFKVVLSRRTPLYGVPHQCGTARFGTDPKTSVLDITCKAHDLDNLYVVDSSFFPSSTSGYPGLTIAANALRVVDHLKERL